MYIIAKKVVIRYDRHRTLILTDHKFRFWIERLFRKQKQVAYIGHKHDWYMYPELTKVSKSLCNQFALVEERHTILKRNKR